MSSFDCCKMLGVLIILSNPVSHCKNVLCAYTVYGAQ